MVKTWLLPSFTVTMPEGLTVPSVLMTWMVWVVTGGASKVTVMYAVLSDHSASVQ